MREVDAASIGEQRVGDDDALGQGTSRTRRAATNR